MSSSHNAFLHQHKDYQTPNGPCRFTLPANHHHYASSLEGQTSSTYQPRRYTQAQPVHQKEIAQHPNYYQQERLASQTTSEARANIHYNQVRNRHDLNFSVTAASQISVYRNDPADTFEKEPTAHDWGAEYGFVRRDPFSPHNETTSSSSSSSSCMHRDEYFGHGGTESYLKPRQSATPTRVSQWVAEQILSEPTPNHPPYANTLDAPPLLSSTSSSRPLDHIASSDHLNGDLHNNIPPPSSLLPPFMHPVPTTPALKGVPVKDLPQGVIASRPSLYRKPVTANALNPAKRKTGILAFRKRHENLDPNLRASIGNAIDALNNPVS